MKSNILFVSVIFSLIFTNIAFVSSTEKIDIGGGVFVTKRTFNAPSNELPFFGFKVPTKKQIQANKQLLDAIGKSGLSKRQAFNRAIELGWQAINQKDLVVAARRFNQAYLIIPVEPSIFHGFAVVVDLRFNDKEFANELFQTGSQLKGRSPGFMADYGRFLLVARKPKQALPVLQQAVVDAPDYAMAWSNLAFAWLETGVPVKACLAAKRSRQLNPPPFIQRDLNILRSNANCAE